MHEVVGRDSSKTNWFASDCCVCSEQGLTRVLVGGYLVGEYANGDIESRNHILVGLSIEGKFHKGKLAKAFGVTRERVRQLLQQFDAEGWEGLTPQKRGGSKPKLNKKSRKILCKDFAEGATVRESFDAHGKKLGVSYSTIYRVYQDWKARAKKAESPAEHEASADAEKSQIPLVVGDGEATSQ